MLLLFYISFIYLTLLHSTKVLLLWFLRSCAALFNTPVLCVHVNLQILREAMKLGRSYFLCRLRKAVLFLQGHCDLTEGFVTWDA